MNAFSVNSSPCDVVEWPNTITPAPQLRKNVLPESKNPEAEVSKSTAQPSGPASYSPRVLKSLFTIELFPDTVPVAHGNIRLLCKLFATEQKQQHSDSDPSNVAPFINDCNSDALYSVQLYIAIASLLRNKHKRSPVMAIAKAR
jgi:hypothetical protein